LTGLAGSSNLGAHCDAVEGVYHDVIGDLAVTFVAAAFLGDVLLRRGRPRRTWGRRTPNAGTTANRCNAGAHENKKPALPPAFVSIRLCLFAHDLVRKPVSTFRDHARD